MATPPIWAEKAGAVYALPSDICSHLYFRSSLRSTCVSLVSCIRVMSYLFFVDIPQLRPHIGLDAVYVYRYYVKLPRGTHLLEFGGVAFPARWFRWRSM